MTLDREPVVWGDDVTYASTARALQTDRSGIPTILRDSPTAVDHIAFYGPVFFRVAATSFDLFGFSIRAFRAVSLASVLLVAGAGAAMVVALGGGGHQRWWAWTLLLMTPELGTAATNGRMDALAVGLELLGLATFVRGLRAERAPVAHGVCGGVFLAAAALTTPRALPFTAAFLLVGVVLWFVGDRRRGAWLQYACAATVVVAALCGWATVSHGSPLQWLRDLTFIGAHEDADVALAAHAREWAFRLWRAVTPAAAAIGAAAWLASRRASALGRADLVASTVALVVCLVTLALTMTAFNGTFLFGTYFAVPLLAVVIALPWSHAGVTPRRVAILLTGLLLVNASIRMGKYVRVAATWAARDPHAIDAFVRRHVPPGSTVIGPQHLFFFAVEGAGAHFRQASPDSWADWTRWVTRVDPGVRGQLDRRDATAARFFLWPADEGRHPIPPEWACARAEAVATFEPAASHEGALGVLRFEEGVPFGYPRSVLYRLPATCP